MVYYYQNYLTGDIGVFLLLHGLMMRQLRADFPAQNKSDPK